MRRYYLIPTWLLLLVSVLTNNEIVTAALFALSAVQSIQLVLYTNDVWLLDSVKLVVFSIFSISNRIRGDKFDLYEEAVKQEKENAIAEVQQYIEEMYDEADSALREAKEERDFILRDAVIRAQKISKEAEEEKRTILLSAGNSASAEIYRAEERARQIIESSRHQASLILEEATAVREEICTEKLRQDDRVMSEVERQLSELDKYSFLSIAGTEQKSIAYDFLFKNQFNIKNIVVKESVFESEEENERMLNFIKSSLEEIDAMSGFDFETQTKIILRELGFSNVIVTKMSGDRGADVLAEKDYASYVIQCKRYEHNVGNDAVQQVYAAKTYYNKDIAVVLTNSRFTESAKSMAEQTSVRLWDRQTLERFLMFIYLKNIAKSK